MELDSLRRTLGMGQYKSRSEETLSWLNDMEDMVYVKLR